MAALWILLVLALGPGRFGPGRKKPDPSPARPEQKSPGRPAGFLNFLLFFKRIADLEFSSEYQKSKYFSKFNHNLQKIMLLSK